MTLDQLSIQSGLSPATIGKINSVFSGCPALERAVLYGSRAKGNYRNGSDIDLVLMGVDLNRRQLAAIESQLDDLLLPYSLDIALFQEINNADLVDHINRVGIVFYPVAI